MYNKKIVELEGIKKACKYLIEKGYRVLEKNFKCIDGDIDIIAKDKNKQLVFIEVKTKELKKDSMAKAKNLNHIYNVAKYYILKNKMMNMSIRFDTIEIMIGKSCYIHHIKQAI